MKRASPPPGKNHRATDVTASRRATLATLVAGAGLAGTALPSHWSRPVVESVLLPAHAQTTGEPPATETAPPRFVFECSIEGIIEQEGPLRHNITFHFTPIDTTGALDGQVVDTVYTAFDSNGDVIFPANVLDNTSFGMLAQPVFTVFLPPFPPGPYTVTVAFVDQGTYGDFTCSDTADPPPP